MSNEINVRDSLRIAKGPLIYQSNPTSFTADLSVANGPGPGVITVAVAGTDVDLSNFAQPGIVWMQNLDDANFITYGTKDIVSGDFSPWGEMLAGEFYKWRFSRYLASILVGGGTGTGGTTVVHIKADTTPCNVRVDCFDT